MSGTDEPPRPRIRIIVTEVTVRGVVLGPWHQPELPRDEELGQTTKEDGGW